jgi:hypothetical protein
VTISAYGHHCCGSVRTNEKTDENFVCQACHYLPNIILTFVMQVGSWKESYELSSHR